MKTVTAYLLMVGGFIWIAAVCLIGAVPHSLWVRHSQNLPTTEMVSKAEAVGQMRQLQTDIQHNYQLLIIPAAMIVIGGIVNGLRTKNYKMKVQQEEKDTINCYAKK